jgi:hypothetical protein
MKRKEKCPLPAVRNPVARELRDPRFHKRVVKLATTYSRKGRGSSTRQFEDSI